MGRITAIEPQKNRSDRVSIYIDGVFAAGVRNDTVAELGIAVGQECDPAVLERILRAEAVKKARESALRLLSYRSRSESEIRKRLHGSGFPEDVVNEIVEQLTAGGLLNDEKFSTDWVRSRSASRPTGRARLQWELRSRGVDPAIVEDALAALDEDAELELALKCARKKAEKADVGDPSFKGKLSSFLRRRGFGWEVIQKTIDRVCPTDGDT